MTPLGERRHRFERRNFLFSPAPFEEGSSCVFAKDPPASGGLRAPLTTLSPISNREAGVLQMQQLFQKHKMKRVLKSFSQFRARKCLRTLSVGCNTASCPVFSSHVLFRSFFSTSFLSLYCFCMLQTNIH